jgi:hypothetical protein
VLTGEGEDVAWHGGEEVRSKVQSFNGGECEGECGLVGWVMRLPGFREDEVWGVHVGWYNGSG